MTGALVLLVLRSTLVLAVALAAARLLRRQSAALRHAVLASAVMAAAALPAVTPVAPAWSWVPARTTPAPRETTTATVSPGQVRVSALTTPAHTSPRRPFAFDTWLMALWAIGTAVCLTRVTRDGWRVRTLAIASTRLDDARWTGLVAALAGPAIASRITLRIGTDDAPIATWGWRRPTILVPAGAVTWPDAEVRHVLAHELAHIARRDWAWHVLLAIASAIYWWQPLMYVAARDARREAEHACDDLVLAGGARSSAYASTLLHVARSRRATSPTAALAMADTSSLERRIRAMLDTSVNHAPLRRTPRALLASACLACTVAVAGLGAQDTGVVTGSVAPAGGTPLAGVTVTFTGPSALEVVTDDAGQFVASLPPGTYRAEIKKPGFKRFAARVDVGAGERVTRDFALALGTVTESIAVNGAPLKPDAGAPFFRPAPQQTNPFAGVLDPPKKLKDVKPIYPEALKASGVGGKVVLAARIGVDGFVTDVQVTSSPDDALTAAAVTAVEQWKFMPTRLQGKPVPTDMTVTVAFEMP